LHFETPRKEGGERRREKRRREERRGRKERERERKKGREGGREGGKERLGYPKVNRIDFLYLALFIVSQMEIEYNIQPQ
jgi:hypothetical protein